MLTKGYTHKVLTEFKKYVVKQARTNLSKGKKNVNGKLYKSIDGDVEVGKTSFSLSFVMEDYGVFQDKGVSGTKKKYNTPYSYTTKMPPPSKLDKWTVKKGIAPRDDKGRFISRKSLQFAIARSIFYKGIKPSLFFTTPFQKYAKGLPKELETAFALDTEALLAFVTKQQLNNK